jgi:hypothetical protein
MKIFTLENLASSTVSEKKLEDIVKNPPSIPPGITTKDQAIKWREDGNTSYVFYSPFEGIVSRTRITEKGGNPAWVLHGLVLDFDQKMTPESVDDAIRNNMKKDYPVRWTSQSFGGGCHMVFEFEEPINILTKELLESFIKLFASRAGVKKLGGGFDDSSFKSHMYYMFGRDWKQRGGVISKNLLHQILFEVGSNPSVFEKVEGAVELPFDVIEREMEKRWPGRWLGGYSEGARGCRVWDPTSTDQSKCVMHSTGIHYFSDGGAFKTWRVLFGSEVVSQFEADRVGAAVCDIYYDGKRYYRHVNGVWLEDNKGTILNVLKLAGLKAKPKKGDQNSEVDYAFGHIDTQQRVAGAFPFIYRKEKIVNHSGEMIINTALVKPIVMADTAVVLERGSNQFYDHLLTVFGEQQCKHLCYWFGWHYFNAVQHNPQLGQAMIIVGKANLGKTLIGKMLGEAMGGSEDIGAFLTGRDDFNGNIFKVGFCTIDDDRAGVGQKSRDTYSSMLKQITANPDVTMRKMYAEGKKMPWPGRVYITLNADSSSLSMIPNLDMSNADKIIILKMKEDVEIDWPTDPTTGRGLVEHQFRQSLPFFCRGCFDLIRNGIPEDMKGGPRFGIKSFIHPDLKKEADFMSIENSVHEMMDIWRKDYFSDNPTEDYYEGTGTLLMEKLIDTFGGSKLLEGLNGMNLPQRLTTLHRKGCSWIEPTFDGEFRGFKIFRKK